MAAKLAQLERCSVDSPFGSRRQSIWTRRRFPAFGVIDNQVALARGYFSAKVVPSTTRRSRVAAVYPRNILAAGGGRARSADCKTTIEIGQSNPLQAAACWTAPFDLIEPAMLYVSNATLPLSVRQQLPPRAQDIYREAFNETWALHASDAGREQHAGRVAWAAVKQRYHLVPGGQWQPNPSYNRLGQEKERL